jgi:Carbohydrate-selective porin, OprB family
MCNSNLWLAGARALLGIAVLLLAWSAGAQGNSPGAPPNGPEQQSSDPITTMFPHPDTAPWFVAAQIDVISQGHAPFHADYSGSLSLNPHSEWRTSEVLTANARVFARWGWNEGQHESYAYTEVDQTWEFGADYRGALWRRNLDRVGAAFVSNGIARPHQQYLALGGHGFLLGDGALDYGRETIEEAYYTVHLWRGLYTGFDLQHINNPGYNRARGPVLVPAIRIHLEL